MIGRILHEKEEGTLLKVKFQSENLLTRNEESQNTNFFKWFVFCDFYYFKGFGIALLVL